jgi:hypothetical protein
MPYYCFQKFIRKEVVKRPQSNSNTLDLGMIDVVYCSGKECKFSS